MPNFAHWHSLFMQGAAEQGRNSVQLVLQGIDEDAARLDERKRCSMSDLCASMSSVVPVAMMSKMRLTVPSPTKGI